MANENEKGTGVVQEQTKSQTGLPTEDAGTPVRFDGYDDHQLIDYEKWRRKQVRKAVQRMQNEKKFRPFKEDGTWDEKWNNNDIYNATAPFGEGHYSTNYEGFFDKDSEDYLGNLGYEIEYSPAAWRKGDLIGNFDGKDHFPPYMYMGDRTVMGDGKYMGDKVIVPVSKVVQDPKTSYRVRFVGTQAERDKINAHDQAINETAMPGIKYLDYEDNTEPENNPEVEDKALNETAAWLASLKKK